MELLKRCCTAFAFLTLSYSAAFAQEATPSPTPLPAEDFQACLPVQDCISNGASTLIESCYSATPSCQSSNHEKNLVSAEQLADRAIAKLQCNTKSFNTRGSCARCFDRASLPLISRYDGDLFHGILGYARRLVVNARHLKCDSLPVRPNRS